MNADSYFAIGKTHRVCQDYARHGIVAARNFAVVSDGCSSSPDTDIGSRLLVLSTIDELRHDPRDLDYGSIIWEARHSVPRAAHPDCLDATLLMLRESDTGVGAHISGDGVVAAITRAGKVQFSKIEFNGGAPAYLSYKLDPPRLDRYWGLGWGLRTLTRYRDGVVADVVTENLKDDSPDDDSTDIGYVLTYVFPRSEFRAVFVFTDGVQSFQRDTGNGTVEVPLAEVVAQLTAIKSFTGSFVERRTKAFLERFCRDNKWHHNDDLGVAAIDLGETP